MQPTVLPEHLNYQHLLYFWFVAREGGVSRAAARLRLSHSTISTQIHALEDFLGAALFERSGRSLVLTSFGRQVLAFADDIFRTGTELVDMAKGASSGAKGWLRVGVVGTLPKSVTYKLLEPAVEGEGRPVLVRQDTFDRLLEELAVARLHLVLADTAPPAQPNLKLFTHVLGSSELLLYGATRLAKQWRPRFPDGLDGAPMLLPRSGSTLRRAIDPWLASHNARVKVVGEFDDAALMRVFGLRGRGLFPVRSALRAEVEERGNVDLVGRLEGVRETYYAVTAERRIREPTVASVVVRARAKMDA
jgi:LysR family transcriptional activator of nhaA